MTPPHVSLLFPNFLLRLFHPPPFSPSLSLSLSPPSPQLAAEKSWCPWLPRACFSPLARCLRTHLPLSLAGDGSSPYTDAEGAQGQSPGTPPACTLGKHNPKRRSGADGAPTHTITRPLSTPLPALSYVQCPIIQTSLKIPLARERWTPLSPAEVQGPVQPVSSTGMEDDVHCTSGISVLEAPVTLDVSGTRLGSIRRACSEELMCSAAYMARGMVELPKTRLPNMATQECTQTRKN
ncbi:uncharacterized protein Tco025E_07653 [Trypanosoma conorhini]|uniref:Uncharacterized protein n=1 Tax=Trypanosoma conorhini TaxID=83891 RepID=A0A3R7NGB4_9TRYP|nr:uncharacterized protein Tco025E_07653 [Trypanosoma conorhini]RNF06132.1 hypothetical protein Tco025E_07653 [Trypanosoma conorhini]